MLRPKREAGKETSPPEAKITVIGSYQSGLLETASRARGAEWPKLHREKQDL